MATNLTRHPTAFTLTTGFNGNFNDGDSAGNAYTSNDTYAATGFDDKRNEEWATCWRGFDFSSIPDAATINSVNVYVERKVDVANGVMEWKSTVWADVTVTAALENLDGTGAIGGTQYSTSTNPTSDAYWNYTMGALPTVAQLKGTNFGVRVQADNNNSGTDCEYFIDDIYITVNYDVSAVLSCDKQTYTLSGKISILTKQSVLLSDKQTYALSGKDVTLTYTPASEDEVLTADKQTYALSGKDVNLNYGFYLDAVQFEEANDLENEDGETNANAGTLYEGWDYGYETGGLFDTSRQKSFQGTRSYIARADGTAGSNTMTGRDNFTASSGEAWSRLYLYLPSNQVWPVNSSVEFSLLRSSTGTGTWIRFETDADGIPYRWFMEYMGGSESYSTTNFAFDEWIRVDLYLKKGSGLNSVHKVWVNGTQLLDADDGAHITDPDRVYAGITDADVPEGCHLYVDAVSVSSSNYIGPYPSLFNTSGKDVTLSKGKKFSILQIQDSVGLGRADAETGSTAEWDAILDNGTHELSVSQGEVPHGHYCWKFTGGGAANYCIGRLLLTARDELFTRFYLYIPTGMQGVASTYFPLFYQYGASEANGIVWLQLEIDSGGDPIGWRIEPPSGGGTPATSSTNFAFDEWIEIEMRTLKGTSNDAIHQVWINEDLVFNVTDSAFYNQVIISSIGIGTSYAFPSGDYFLVDSYKNDSSRINSFPRLFNASGKDVTLTYDAGAGIALSGTIASTTSTTSTLSRIVTISGTINSTTSTTATLTRTVTISGTIASTTSTTGTIYGYFYPSGFIDSTTSTQATLTTQRELSGSINSTTQTTSSIRLLVSLSGTIASTTSTVAAIAANYSVAGTIDSTTTTTASLSTTGAISLSGTIASTTSSSASIAANYSVTATIASTTSTDSSLMLNISSSGTINSTTQAVATLTTSAGVEISGTIASTTSTDSSLMLNISSSGTINSTTSTQADIVKLIGLLGTTNSTTSISSNLRLNYAASGVINSSTSTSGNLIVISALIIRTDLIDFTIEEVNIGLLIENISPTISIDEPEILITII